MDICSTSTSPDIGYVVRSDLWFVDGNIVIIAGPAAFKVHRGQLGRHSEFFSGLFSLPQPPQGQQMIDGCVCVELHDCPSDVYYFLTALYDGLYFTRPRATDYPAIAAVLRLSTKYLVDPLRQRCIARLSSDFPITLAGWDLRELEARDEAGRYSPRASYPHPVLIIELALELDATCVLIPALYDLSRYGPSKIMAGAHPPALAFNPRTPDKSSPGLITLPRDILCITLRGRENSQRFMSDFIARELQSRSPSAECAHQHDVVPSGPCHESFYFITLNILRSIGGVACGRDADPFFSLDQAMSMLSRTDFSDGQTQCGLKLCQPCKAEVAALIAKARGEAWDLLPSWFGFPCFIPQD